MRSIIADGNAPFSAAAGHASLNSRGVSDSAEVLRLVSEHAPLVIWATDAQGIITMSQGRGLERLGLQPNEEVGRSIFEVYRDFPAIIAMLHEVYAGQEIQRIVEVSGNFFDSWICPRFDASGQVMGLFGVASDITSRVRAEDSLRSSSQRFLKAFHASPAGIMVSDLISGKILDVNDALCQLVGIRREELIGKTTVEVGFWPDYESRGTTIRHAIENGGQCRFDLQFRVSTGRTLRVKIVVEVIELEGQRCALSIIRDDQHRRRVLRQLHKTRRRYQTLARFAPVGIFQARANGELSYVNHQLCGLLNRPSADLRGNGWWSCVLESDRPALQERWQQAIATRQPLTCEFRVTGPENPVWLLLRLEPEKDSRSFVGSLTDISQRKSSELELQLANERLEENVRLRTELLMRASRTLEQQIFERRRTYEELEKSEGRWRALVEGAPDIILLVDREGQIQYINHTEPRSDLNPESVIGRSVYELVYERYHDNVREVLARVFDHGEAISHEIQGPGAEGEERWFQSHLAPIQYLGRVISATAIVRDITERKAASEHLRHTQDQLAHSGRVSMVGEMMAGFAHELGQPLFAISSYIDGCLIRLQREENIPDDVGQVLREAVQQSHRAIAVVRRLREFLRRQDFQRTAVDFNEVVADAVQLAEVGIRKHDSQSQLRLGRNLPLIEIDRIQMMQVLVNLLLNAAESMSEVQGRARLVTICTEWNSGQIVCQIQDQGPGLPPGKGSTIFDAFVTTKEKGLGLGLSISRSIVNAHGGTISAENGPDGVGAVFTIKLPVS